MVYPGTGIKSGMLRPILDGVAPLDSHCWLSLVGFPSAGAKVYKQEDLNSRTSIYPRMSQPELVRLLDRHHIAVVLDPKSRYGSAKASIRLVESMARGLAVLSWDVGETARIVQDSRAGITVPFGNTQALRDAVSTLVSDEPLRRRCAEAALGYSRTHATWSDNAKTLIRVFELRSKHS